MQFTSDIDTTAIKKTMNLLHEDIKEKKTPHCLKLGIKPVRKE